MRRQVPDDRMTVTEAIAISENVEESKLDEFLYYNKTMTRWEAKYHLMMNLEEMLPWQKLCKYTTDFIRREFVEGVLPIRRYGYKADHPIPRKVKDKEYDYATEVY